MSPKPRQPLACWGRQSLKAAALFIFCKGHTLLQDSFMGSRMWRAPKESICPSSSTLCQLTQFFAILRFLSTCRILSVTLMVTSFADIRLASLLTSMVRRPFCFWVRGPEVRLWGFGHWVPQLIFFSGLDIPPGAADRGIPLEDSPSSSTPLTMVWSMEANCGFGS